MLRLTRSVLLAGALLMPTLAFADSPPASGTAPAAGDHPGHRGHRGHRRFMGPRKPMSERLAAHAQELGITSQQLAVIKAAEDAARPELEKLHQTMREQREALEAGKGNLEQLKATRQAMHTRHQALRAQVEGILTPDQRAKLEAKRQEMKQRHGRWKGEPPAAPAK